MRLLVLATLLLPLAQATPPPPPAAIQIQSDLQHALLGDWTGVLQYRDYSEPPTSTRRVQLPTWLSITTTENAQAWHYLYDDGPSKFVEETDTVRFDPGNNTYTESDNAKPGQTYTVVGYQTLRHGFGQLILSAPGTDNDQPAEHRVTLTLGRNILTILEETRPAGSSEPFAFRHAFTFVRASPSRTLTSAK